MAKKKAQPAKRPRRSFDRDFKLQAVQMMLDGYSASSVADNLGRAAMVVRTGAYAQAFNRLDKNSDGAVSREEIQDLADERG